jgi:hypothetical protein
LDKHGKQPLTWAYDLSLLRVVSQHLTPLAAQMRPKCGPSERVRRSGGGLLAEVDDQLEAESVGSAVQRVEARGHSAGFEAGDGRLGGGPTTAHDVPIARTVWSARSPPRIVVLLSLGELRDLPKTERCSDAVLSARCCRKPGDQRRLVFRFLPPHGSGLDRRWPVPPPPPAPLSSSVECRIRDPGREGCLGDSGSPRHPRGQCVSWWLCLPRILAAECRDVLHVRRHL